MKIIAITGSIGCGKTFIADIFKSMGYCIFDADKIVKFLYKKRNFLKIIKENFPESFDDEGIFIKRRLRNIVFNDNEKLKKLESLIHPYVRNLLKLYIRKKSKNTEFLFLDIALLFEMNLDIYCDYIILADVDKKIQKQRVIKRDKISEEDFEKIYKLQINNNLKKHNSDFIVDTNRPKGIIKVDLINFINEIE